MARKRVQCPLRNKEYSNLTALLTHMQIRNTKMTWQPTTCKIIDEEIIHPSLNTPQNKWRLILEHNNDTQTQEAKNLQAAPYLENY